MTISRWEVADLFKNFQHQGPSRALQRPSKAARPGIGHAVNPRAAANPLPDHVPARLRRRFAFFFRRWFSRHGAQQGGLKLLQNAKLNDFSCVVESACPTRPVWL
jgi:hypothetical protein